MAWIDGEFTPSSTCQLGGGPSGSSGSGTGSTANVYTPTAQPQSDTLYQNIINSTFAPYAQNPSTTPAGQAYGQFTNSPAFAALSSPDFQQAGIGAAGQAGSAYTGGIFPGAFGGAQNLIGAGNNFNTAFNSNPFAGDPVRAAQYAAQYGGPTANAAFGAGQDLLAASPYMLQAGANVSQDILGQADPLRGLAPGIIQAGQTAGQGIAGAASPLQGLGSELIGAGRTAGQGIAGAADPLAGLSGRLIGAGFDPQQQLYEQLRQRTLNTANANNAFSGVGNTPYGADVANKAASDFDINWQDRQLGREATAANAARGVQGEIGSLLSGGLGAQIQGAGAGTGVQNAIGSLLSGGLGAQVQGLGAGSALQNAIGQLLERSTATRALGNQSAQGLARSGLDLGSGATALEASSGALPSNTYMSQLGQLMSGLSGAGNLIGQGANLGTSAASGLNTFGGLPFNTASQQGQSLLQNLTGGSNLGTAQFALPQQTLQDLQSYLGLGQSASGISGQLGQLGQNQLQNSLSGFGGLAGSLFGGPGGGGGIGSGLFGSGGGLLSGAGGDFGGGGAALGVADSVANAGGGADIASSLLPTLALS